MRIIKSNKIRLTKEIKEFTNEQIDSLEEIVKKNFEKEDFNSNLKEKINLLIEIGKETEHHKKGPYFYTKCQMNFPGGKIMVKGLSESLKGAITEMKNILEREIKKYKGKLRTKFERGARKLKREIKISEFAKKKEGKRVLEEGK